MQDQLCVEINIAQNDIESPKKVNKIRNRRYKKLKELRENGFFSEDSIKLRHPLLYHSYLGNHTQRNTVCSVSQSTLSQFLHKNLLNLEYKAKLEQQLNSIEGEKGGMQVEQQLNTVQLQRQLLFGQKSREQTNEKAWQIVQEQQIQLQEQNLIDHAEQLFLQGKVDPNYINYKEIDNNSDYDELDQENRDAEERYFHESSNEEDQEINLRHYTGVQDY